MITIDGLIVKTGCKIQKVTMKLEIGKVYYVNKRENNLIKYLINYKQYPEIKIKNNILGIIYISAAGYLIKEYNGLENIKFYQKQFKASANFSWKLIDYFNFTNCVKLKVSDMNKKQLKILNIICMLLNQKAQVIIIEELLIDLDEATIKKIKAYIDEVHYKYVVIYISCNEGDANFLDFCQLNMIDK